MSGDEASRVTVTKISAVAPSVPTARHRMFLSNLDLHWILVNNVQRLLFYKLSPEIDYSSTVERLKQSLASALVYFYPLAGRLDKGESDRPEVDCNDAGVDFIEASIDIPFHDLEKDGFQRKPFFENLAPAASLFQQENRNTSLLSVQVTAFKDGGLCIGTLLHHVLADGNSFWHFMKSWAECSRGVPVSKPPEHRRTVFKLENMRPVSISFKAEEVTQGRLAGAKIYKCMADDAKPEHKKAVDVEKFLEKVREWTDHKTELAYSTFIFTEEKIRRLKELTGASSSFVAVAAQFWRSMMKARKVAEEKPVVFALLADCRGRMNPPLPQTYFGNCLTAGIVETAAGKLQSEDVCFAAGLIQELVNSCATEAQLNALNEWLESMESPESASMSAGYEFMTRVGVNVSSSNRFPVYEVDYGWGKPLNVQAASMNEIGGMVLFGSSDGSAGIAVSTRLPRDEMDILTRLLSLV